MSRRTLVIAGITVTVETPTSDEALLGGIATMLAEAVEQNGPCILTRQCNPDDYFEVEYEGLTARVLVT